MYVEYGKAEIDYLKSKDKRLGEAIDKIGEIKREAYGDLFSAVVNSIIGQQVSTAAHKTVWLRLKEKLGEVTPQTVTDASVEDIQSCGMTFKKVEYIKSFAEQVASGSFDIKALWEMEDSEVIKSLSSLNGIGVWTAEMLMTFCMGRPDIVSYGDLAILRGMRMLYRHRVLTKELFNKYKKRYSPYGTTASLYLWAIAGGAIEGLTDPKR